jgi:hypothetical protein
LLIGLLWQSAIPGEYLNALKAENYGSLKLKQPAGEEVKKAQFICLAFYMDQ